VRLPVGTRVGRYHITAILGEGGMGEVYRARDDRLSREVAIKILPSSVSAHPDRIRRFEQEARATGALNHPNVVVVHDTGQHDNAPYVVYELLDGKTLREMLTGAPLPAARAIRLGIEIAAGLAAAHERAIVHRDLKPENLFVTREGRVKILDFGIASVAESVALADDAATKQATDPGVVLGTVGYMSPEQARGERVDHRSDIFSLGVVLYEMLSGQRPFKRASAIETLNAIISDEPPDLPAGAADTLPALERIVRHCLEKPPDLRFQSARDVAFALEGVGTRSGAHTVPAASRSRSALVRIYLPWTAALLATIAAMVLATSSAGRETSPERLTRFEVRAPDGGAFQGIFGVSSVISPDGTTLAMVVTTEKGPQLFLRSLDSTALRLVTGSEGASNPFWKPDSRSIGFFAANKMKRVGVDGGAPQTVCDVPFGPWRVGSWSSSDMIIFTGSQERGDIWRVPAGGGDPVVLRPVSPSPPNLFGWPWFLPDGKHFLFFEVGIGKPSLLRVGSLDSPDSTILLQVHSRAVYAEPGYLLFVREGTLMAQAFDVSTLTLSGSPVPVAEDLLYFRDLGQADFSVSSNGILAYQAGNTQSRLVWFRRNGSEDTQVGEPADYWFTNLSRDERLLAVDVMDRRAGTTDIQLFDLARGGKPSSVTLDSIVDWTPMFSPDASQLAFSSARRGAPHVHVKGLNDSAPAAQLLPPSSAVQFVTDWFAGPNGPFVVFQELSAATGLDLMQIPASGKGSPVPLVQTRGADTDGRVSPSGRWLAYVSNESGRSEVYVRPLEGGSRSWRVSTAGGVSPRWRRDGRELFYIATASTMIFGATVSDGRLMAVEVTEPVGVFSAGIPKLLFPVQARGSQYEVTRDGQRFLINTGVGPTALPITVTLNWSRGLAR
jgi:eukaryotic-like serine/threonine-protein kinase